MHFTGLSLGEPRRIAFRYRLLGFDAAWQNTNHRQVAYTNLRPGTYRFQVLAQNLDGVWSTQPAQLAFTILPAFYQTLWFAVLCGAAGILCIVLGASYRERLAVERTQRLFEARLAERTRIAQDLHDHLLQDVMGIGLHLEVADELAGASAPEKKALRRAISLTSSALTQGRGALTQLRSAPMPCSEFLLALTRVRERFPAEKQREVRWQHTGSDRVLRASVQGELLAIGREALANALQHTATPVDVSTRCTRQCFWLTVQDRGPGIADAVRREGAPGHFGIVGMRERATRMGATLRITGASDPAWSGTRIELKLPGSIAYDDNQSRAAAAAATLRAWWRKIFPGRSERP